MFTADPGGPAVCGRLVAGIACSNPAEGIGVCVSYLYVVLSCVGRGLCDGLITRPEELYRVCVIKKPQYRGGQGSDMGYSAIGNKSYIFCFLGNRITYVNVTIKFATFWFNT
jgi:hypothetical protein